MWAIQGLYGLYDLYYRLVRNNVQNANKGMMSIMFPRQ